MRRRKLHAERITSVSEEMLVASGVPRRYWNAQLSAIEGEPEYKVMLGQYMDRIHEHTDEGMGLLLYGGFETGKSSLAIVVLKEAIHRGGIAHFISSRDIPSAYFEAAELEAAFGDPIVIKDRIRRSNLIVIDDLGAESFDQKGPAGAEIERVLREAYEEMQTVIMTTNAADPKDLEGKFTQGVVSLLGRITTQIEVKTSQWRKKK